MLFTLIKNELAITWSDEETDIKVARIISNAISTLNFKLGADIDYSEEGIEQELFIAYCVYAWNGCLNEFDDAYFNNIMQIRMKYEVQQHLEGDDDEV